jgi:hypothetical protein
MHLWQLRAAYGAAALCFQHSYVVHSNSVLRTYHSVHFSRFLTTLLTQD